MDALSEDSSSLGVTIGFKPLSLLNVAGSMMRARDLLDLQGQRASEEEEEEECQEGDPSLFIDGDLAKRIIDSLFVQPWSSSEVVAAIRKRPDHLRLRMCSDSYAQLIAQMFEPETALFSMAVLSACVIALPDDPFDLAEVLVPELVPFLSHPDMQVREEATRLGGEVIWSYPVVDEPFQDVMWAATDLHMHAIDEGNYPEKMSAWIFFHTLMHANQEIFFTVVPPECRGQLQDILLNMQGFNTLDDFLESKLESQTADMGMTILA
jgi:hypothetical protein